MRRRTRWQALILAGLFATACMPWRGPDDVARLAARETGAAFEPELGLTIGRTGMALTRWAVRTAGEDEALPLAGISKLEIGIWKRVRAGRTLGPSSFAGYSTLAAVHSTDGEDVFVLHASREERIRRLVVVVSDAEELVVVRLRGDVERMLADAVRFALEEAQHPELAEPTIEALADAPAAG